MLLTYCLIHLIEKKQNKKSQSDWQRTVQYKCNTSENSVTPLKKCGTSAKSIIQVHITTKISKVSTKKRVIFAFDNSDMASSSYR